MCILNSVTPVIAVFYAVIIEILLHYFCESISLRELARSTWRAEIRRPNAIYIRLKKTLSEGLPNYC